MKLLTSTAARLLITAAILAYLLRSIDIGASMHAMLRVNPWWFTFTLALVAVDRVVMAIRWLLLLRAANVDITASSALRIFLTSSFIGSFLPAGVGADAARAYAVASRTSRGSQAVASVGIDRYSASWPSPSWASAGWQAGPATSNRRCAEAHGRRRRGRRCGAGGVLGGQGRQALPARALARHPLGMACPASRRRPRRVPRAPENAGPGAGALHRRPGGAGLPGGYGLGRGLGIQVDLAYYLVFMPIAMLVLLLPVSISGFGLPQAAIVWLLRPVGVPDAQSLALSTLLIVIGIIGNLPGALLYAVRKKPVT